MTFYFKSEQSLWNLGKLNHIAIAVPDMDSAVNFYKNALNATNVSEKQVGYHLLIFIPLFEY